MPAGATGIPMGQAGILIISALKGGAKVLFFPSLYDGQNRMFLLCNPRDKEEASGFISPEGQKPCKRLPTAFPACLHRMQSQYIASHLYCMSMA